MGGKLAIGELEVLAREEDRVGIDVALSLGDLNEGLQGVQESGSSASLQDDLVGVHEQRRLRKDVRVEVRVRGRSNDGAVDRIQNVRLPVLGGDGAQTLRVRSVRAEADLNLLLSAFKSSVGDSLVDGHVVQIQKPVYQSMRVSFSIQKS